MEGKVKWFDQTKGYGFIETHGGNEVFMHRTAIDDDYLDKLREGSPVEFEIHEGDRGPEAASVKLSDR